MADKVGIALIGDTGMVGQELDKHLTGHPGVEIRYRRNSTRETGSLGSCALAFLATKDAESMAQSVSMVSLGLKVIDMSGAFRLEKEEFEKWYGLAHSATELLSEAVYGMPALYAERISTARLVANPGCYPTGVILALKPLTAHLKREASVVATSGNSGARREVESGSNEIAYSFGRRHKHVPEMERYSGFRLDFCPIVLRSVFRGINAVIRVELNPELAQLSAAEAESMLAGAISQAYRPEDRVHVVRSTGERQWGTRDIQDSHEVLIQVHVDEGFAYLNALVDNLSRGAATQGVENMNLMLGIDREAGLPPRSIPSLGSI